MENRGSSLKNLLAVTALLLVLAALQSPLRPAAAPQRVTATTGGSAILTYEGSIDKAVIFQKRTAILSALGPGQLAVHGLGPGTTNLLIRFKDGNSHLYEIVVPPGQAIVPDNRGS